MNGPGLVPLKYLVQINRRALPDTTNPDYEFWYLDIGAIGRGAIIAEPQRMTFATAPSRARRLVSQGDTIVSTVRTYLRAVYPVRGDTADLVVSTGFAVLTPGPSLDPRYLGWWAQSDPFIEEIVARSVGVSYPAISPSELGGIVIHVPGLHRQRAVADFLDDETARIDDLIAKKLRMSSLLKERWVALLLRVLFGEETTRRFLTGETVTTPDGWEMRSLIDLTDRSVPIVYGILLPGPRLEVGVPYIGAGEVAGGRLRHEHLPRTSWKIASQYPRSRVRPGELVYAIRGTFGSVEQIPLELDGVNLSRDAARISPSPRVNSRWLMYALKSEFAQEQFRRKEVGATVTGINIEDLKRVRLLVPPRGEQDKIIDAVESNRRMNLELLDRLARQTILLNEHRQSLVTAAVTGQLEIPGVAA
jgi:type I restriction enzyme S subunit